MVSGDAVTQDELLDALLWRWGASWPWIPDDHRPVPEDVGPAAAAAAEVLGDGFDTLDLLDFSREAGGGTAAAWVVSRNLACLVTGDGDGGALAGPIVDLTALAGTLASAIGPERPTGDGIRIPTAIAHALLSATRASGGRRPSDLDLPDEVAGAVLSALADEGIIALDRGIVQAGPAVDRFPALRALASGDAFVIRRHTRTPTGVHELGALRLVGARDNRWLDVMDGPDTVLLPLPAATEELDPVLVALLDLATAEAGPPSMPGPDADVVFPGLEDPSVVLHLTTDRPDGRSTAGVAITADEATTWVFDGQEVTTSTTDLVAAAAWLSARMCGPEPEATLEPSWRATRLGALVEAIGASRCVARHVLRGSGGIPDGAARLDLTILETDAGSVLLDGLPYAGPPVALNPATPDVVHAQFNDFLAVFGQS